jgi:carbon-monoxide dehydrogenase small subunit
MIISAKALLDRDPNPTEDDICEALSGNLCRCTGYTQIVEAIQMAAERMQEARDEIQG